MLHILTQQFKLIQLNIKYIFYNKKFYTHNFSYKKFYYKKISMSLISTVFILFIMSLITQFLLNISHHNISDVNRTIQGQHALFAAKNGVVWGITNAIINQSCPNPTNININQEQFKGFSINVNCSFINSNTIRVIAIANYKNIADNNYVTRTMTGKYQLISAPTSAPPQ